MFGRTDSTKSYQRIGVTSPIFIPRGEPALPIRPGEYFWIRVHSAQAAFKGSIFSTAKQLIVTSRVNLNHPVLGDEEVYAIQRSREVQRGRAEQLGLSSNLVSMVPATMTHVSVSIEYLLDLQNHLATLASLINDKSFLAAVSLAPGAAAVAKTVGSLAHKVIQTFIPAEEREPILQFTGDFNLNAGESEVAESGLRDGYYIILGTRDADNPLPDPLPKLEIADGTLLADGQLVTQLSYIVLDVTRVPVRTRDLNNGATWNTKLREAEGLAQEFADDPFADDEQARDIWRKCKKLLQDAHALLLADPNYVAREADSIYQSAYKQCADTIRGATPGGVAKGPAVEVDTKADRVQLDIDEDADLDRVVETYVEQVEEARQILAEREKAADNGLG